jgi:L-rhamnose mutarotase
VGRYWWLITLSLIACALAAGCANREAAQARNQAQQDQTQRSAEIDQVQRYGMVIGLKPEKIERYKELHANPWPDVLKQITECNIRNYSIYLIEVEPEKYYLFSYFEYVGDDFDADMKKMAADATTQEWWKETDPCQVPLPTRKEGEFWARAEEVFHLD